MKRCCTCGELKPYDDFWKHGRTTDRRHPSCKPCARAYHRNKWAKTPLLQRFYRRARQGFGLTQEQAESLCAVHGWTCWSCGVGFGARAPNIDHDHDCCPGNYSCGKCVRGFLCTRCNVALSYFENVEVMANLLAYLKASDDRSWSVCPHGAALDQAA